MRRHHFRAVAAILLVPAVASGQRAAGSATPSRVHPLPVVGSTRERFAAVDAVTLGDRIFVVERAASGGWLRVYDASDVANPLEIRDGTASLVGRPLAIAGNGNRVLVASVTEDTTRLRLTLFDVARADRSRWSGAASLPIAVPVAGVSQMYLAGDRATVQVSYGPMVEMDLRQLERDFTTATRGDESSAAARAILRALAVPGSTFGDVALAPSNIDTAYRAGKPEQSSGWTFAQNNQLASRVARKGALVRLEGQWVLDILDADTRRIEFSTRTASKNVNSLPAPDSGDVLVNDLVRVDTMAGRQIAVFNATIIGPTHREKAWEGGAFVDVTDPRAPRVIGIDRRSSIDTSSLGYGWRSYVRDVVVARDAIVQLDYDSTRIARFDGARMTGVDVTGRFVGRLVPGPDGTVLELSVESGWRDIRRLTRADTTVPAIRIRATTPRLAVRDAPAAIPVDERGRTTASQRFRFEIISPHAIADPAQLTIGASEPVTVPVVRRGPLLEARLPAGSTLGAGATAIALRAGAAGQWIVLAAPPTALPSGATRAFVALGDPFTAGTIVIADSGGNPATDAAFVDRRLRARLERDSITTILAVPGRDGFRARIVRRDRGRADVSVARASTIASYPAPATVASLAALRHLGGGRDARLALCLRDAIGKRVEEQYSSFANESPGDPPCGDEEVLRTWIRARGGAVVEGPGAAIVIDRRYVPPVDSFVEAGRRTRWASARAEFKTDTSSSWGIGFVIEPDTAASGGPAPAAQVLTMKEREAITAAVADAALLETRASAFTDSTDSTVAVIRAMVTAIPVPGDSEPRKILALDDYGAIVYGDWSAGRFVPLWERWSYTSIATPQFIDLDGDALPEIVFTAYDHDAKGHVVSQELWAYDPAGRELTSQASTTRNPEVVYPISADIDDSEECQLDCGMSLGSPAEDGTRPIVTSEGKWVLSDHRYVFRPNPPRRVVTPTPARKAPPKAGGAGAPSKKPTQKKPTP